MALGIRPGPDPGFPFLGEYDRFYFPPPEGPSSVVAYGGNLSPGMLLSAYEQGIFPWYSQEDPLLWQSPDPRFVIFPQNLHISRSMKKLFKQNVFEIAFDLDFSGVINACADIPRPGQDGTWITPDMIAAYTELHRLGWAHSAESYLDGKLAGGCYGIRLGRVFFGESMFTFVPNASKAAFIALAAILFADGAAFIDCQTPTIHLRSLGGGEIKRADFLPLLKKNLGERQAGESGIDHRGDWGKLYPLASIRRIINANIIQNE